MESWAKLNVDGSYKEQSGDTGVGAVARDSNGTVIFMAWKFVGKCSSAPETEALTCTEGLRWEHQRGLSHVIVESDCTRIIASLRSQTVDRSEVGPIMEEARGLIQLMRDWKCSLVKRDYNHVTNALALLARRCKHSAA